MAARDTSGEETARPNKRHGWGLAAAGVVLVGLLLNVPTGRADCAEDWRQVGGGLTIVDDRGEALITYDGALIIGGAIHSVGSLPGTAVNHIARWNGSTWSALGTGTSDDVRALAVYQGDLVAAGDFETAGGIDVNGIARWDGAWHALGTGVDLPVHALVVHDGLLIVGGEFDNAGGNPAAHIAAWNGTAWSALGLGLNGTVEALASDGTYLYAGGTFNQAGGGAALNLARWDGTNWSALGAGVNGAVQALTVHDGQLIAGGAFTQAGGNPAAHIAAWDGAWSTLGAGINGTVEALLSDGTYLYAGGTFTTAGAATVSNVARWNGSAWEDMAGGFNDTVAVLGLHDGQVHASGDFRQADGTTCHGLARWGLFGTPPQILTQPTAQGLCPGGDVTLTITATEADSYRWRRGATPLVNGGNIAGATTPSLAISDVAPGDAAVYTCDVTNPCGTTSSLGVTLTVHAPPTVLSDPASQHACGNTLVTLAVNVAGSPAPSYVWRRNGQPIDGAVAATYTIQHVSVADAGEYDVVVLNQCGTALSGAATLTVTPAVEIQQHPADVTVDAGQSASLSVLATGSGLTYQWRHNGTPLTDDGHFNWTNTALLMINAVAAGDAGAYDVIVFSDCGAVTSNYATLTVGGGGGNGDPNDDDDDDGDDDGNDDDGSDDGPFVPGGCAGGAACGAGVGGFVPLTLAGLGGLKLARRRRGR